MKQKAFTLIEMIVVIGVIAFALPTVFAIFFIILQQQSRAMKLLEIKKQGTFVSDVITSTIRQNAANIYTSDEATHLCYSGDQTSHKYLYGDLKFPLYFLDSDGHWFHFDYDSGAYTIASESSVTTSTDLTSSNAIISSGSIIQQCSASGYGSPVVTINYTVCYHDAFTMSVGSCGSGADYVALPFQVSVTLPLK